LIKSGEIDKSEDSYILEKVVLGQYTI